ncbi:ankyrin repeat-containing domain protein [Aspergillus carlsbadensis]|nr:ankyrin repeat-containing domain protein [Aspergillus carlsbadensis]
MSLQHLPPELLHLIISNLETESDMNSLAQTTRHLHTLTNPHLYTHNAKHSRSTALTWAANSSNVRTARLALSHGADPNAIEHGTALRTPLAIAANNGAAELVRLLVSAHDDAPNADTYNGITGPIAEGFMLPFVYALAGGHAHIARQLLATGKVDVNARAAAYEQTLLCLFAGRGNEVIVRVLVELAREGVQLDVDARDCDGMTALAGAAAEGREGVVAMLLGMDVGVGVDVDARDGKRMTPLACAAENGHEGVVRMLLATGKVDVTAADGDGVTPLMRAVRRGHDGVVKLLEKVTDAGCSQ